ncbi:Protein tamozhennic [Pseudolycoriella hygida]|uniref:Protein tamozhennic n=1 Tax=Pseudolycoriella hygida TaxID=35572 RepID=A0A9Q0N6L8_9DIPT|nr:Protein tamozhennic [Pseudolycoriella hygida]
MICIKIWETLYELHWDYIQTEENSTDLLLKKDKLKNCIQEFLSTTAPDRKFYLPETIDVLRRSIQKHPHFDAYAASAAFDAIAQYANNLLTKPWRAEYKLIKTYSGFYQHKIKSQLVDEDKMFIAMGYVKSENQTLKFDGQICEDQLANVSRDCMIACEECLLMHRLYYGLQDNKYKSTWADILKFRESYLGDEQQSLISIQQKKHKDKGIVAEHYINPVHVQQQQCNCTFVNAINNPQYQPCHYNYQSVVNNECPNHYHHAPPVNHLNYFQPHYEHVSYLPHSRSMEQYNDRVPISHTMFRRSLDHSTIGDTVDSHKRFVEGLYPTATLQPSFYNNHLAHGSEYATSNRPTNANFPCNRPLPRSFDQPTKYNDHSSMAIYQQSRNCDEDLIKFEDSQKTISKSERNYNHSDLAYDAPYSDQLRKADSQFNRPTQVSYANALKQNLNYDKPLEERLRELSIDGQVRPSKELREVDRSLDRQELRRSKNNQILSTYELDDQHSRDSRASDFDSADYAYDEENAKAIMGTLQMMASAMAMTESMTRSRKVL